MADALSRLSDLVVPIVADAGCELYDLVRDGKVVRVTIDHPDGVGLDALRSVTRAVSVAIDEHDPVPGSFTLEVTSPGLERRLRLPGHFAGAVGETISVKTFHPVPDDGGVDRRRVRGELISADGVEIVVVDEESGATVRVPLDAVSKAQTVFVWEQGAKPGSHSQRKASSS